MQHNKGRLEIPENVAFILKTAGAIGDGLDFKVFAVGGFVRDLLLGIEKLDIDIVAEGNGLKFAKELADALGSPFITHEQFGTAVIENDIKVDVATARSEFYKSPADYPSVRFGTIKEDLKRRDFTINAIAASLNAEAFAEMLDLFNGRKDLKKGIIRVLHDKSFIDDPTRIFRAVRFEQRYNFKIDDHTEKLIKHAVSAGMLGRLKKQRIEKEMALISAERMASSMLIRLEGLTGRNNVAYRQGK